MGLFGLGFVTIALFIGLFSVQEQYQYQWLVRGYLIMVVHALGLRIEHIGSTIAAITGAINATL